MTYSDELIDNGTIYLHEGKSGCKRPDVKIPAPPPSPDEIRYHSIPFFGFASDYDSDSDSNSGYDSDPIDYLYPFDYDFYDEYEYVDDLYDFW